VTYGGDPELAAGVREGQVLAGKYRVDRVLGVGGMGVVVAAYNLVLDTRVALKFLLPAMLANQEAVARFLREARAAAKIVSEHAARVHDVGTLDNGSPYIVMELLEGGDLAEWLRQRGPLPIDLAVDFVLQACVAIAEAHRLGIVHRDLKPANLFCVRGSDGQFVVKVLDFGISKLTEAARASEPPGMSVTKTAAVMGSPLYMSPEQMRSAKDVDALTDIWALGVVLFQLLTGTTPFVGEAIAEVAVKVTADPVPSPRAMRPDVPPGLEAIIFKCLQKDRRDRYPNVAALGVALLPFGSRRARTSVERITGILQEAGLAASGAPLPPSARGTMLAPASMASWSGMRPGSVSGMAPGSVAPWSDTQAGGGHKKAVVGAIAVIAVAVTVGGFFAVRLLVANPKGLNAATASSTSPGAPPEGPRPAVPAAVDRCASGATQCRATTPETCVGDRWAAGPVTAGQCGAECSPATSTPRCSDRAPERCDEAGHWNQGATCPYACSDGQCIGVCAPGSTQCAGGGVQACGASGEWGDAVACAKSSVCRSGVCVALATTAPLHADVPRADAPRADCDPNYTIDPQSGAHVFKPQCFSNSHGGAGR